MEFQILLPAFLFLLLLVKIVKRGQANGSALHLPPGPSKLPLIGNLHNLITSLPHRKLRDLSRKYGSGGIMHLQLGEISAVVISSSEFAQQVMMVHDVVFASRPIFSSVKIFTYDATDIVFSPYGEYWRQLKKICTVEFLTAKRVKTFRPIREAEMRKLVKSIASKEGSSPVNLSREIDTVLYTITSRAAFGARCEDQDEYAEVAKELIKAADGFKIVDLYPSAKWIHSATGATGKLMKLQQRADMVLGKIIEEHKMKISNTCTDGEAEIEDFVDVLLKFHKPNEEQFHLTTDNIKAIITDVFIAGSDTSSTTIDWAMSELIKNPGVMRKVQAEVRDVFDRRGKVDEEGISEMPYLKLVIKETLRLHPALPLLLPRLCRQDCKIGGYDIPEKTKVIINAWAINRDPSLWAEPDSFIPERFMDISRDYKGTHFDYIPFGSGRRMCPGITYGIANVEVVLAFLLYHFNWKLPNGKKNGELDMAELNGAVVRRKLDLELIPIIYQPRT